MSIPIIGMAAGLGVGAASGVVGGLVNAMFQPAFRGAGYNANINRPNLLPAAGDLFDAFARGFISEENLTWLLRLWGIEDWEPAATKEARLAKIKAWKSSLEGRRPRLAPADLQRLYQRGYFANPVEFMEQWRWTGAKIDDWRPFAEAGKYSLTRDEYRIGHLRGIINPDGFKQALKRIGIVSKWDQDIVEEMAKVIPGITDLITSLVKDAWNPQAIVDRKLDEGYPPQFGEWAGKQGYNWKMFDLPLPDGRVLAVTPALLAWMAHWQPVSPTLSFRLEQRLRATGKQGGGPRDDSGLVWTRADTIKALRISDYPPGDVEKIAAVAFLKPGLRQIADLHYYGVIPEQGNDRGKRELSELFQDISYDRKSADLMADGLIRKTLFRRNRELLNLTRAKIEEAYTVGIVTFDRAVQLLVQIGWGQNESVTAVTAWQLALVTGQTKKVIAGIRRNFLLGDYDTIGATDALTQAGVFPARIADYLLIWEQERRQYRLEYSPQRLTEWLLYGVIDVAEFSRRLGVLGYPEDEQARIIQAALLKIREKVPPEKKVPKGKGGRGGQGKAKELSLADVKLMFLKQILSQDETITELQQQGFDGEDIGRLFELWGEPSAP